MKNAFVISSFILLLATFNSTKVDASRRQALKTGETTRAKVRLLARSTPVPRTSFGRNEERFVAEVHWPRGGESNVKLVYSFALFERELPEEFINSGELRALRIQRMPACDSTLGAMNSVYRLDPNGRITKTEDGLMMIAGATLSEVDEGEPLTCFQIYPKDVPKEYR